METRAKKKQRLEAKSNGDATEKTAEIGRHPSLFALMIGQRDDGDGQLNAPMGVAVGIDGVIYVADYQNHRLQCYDCNGTFLRKWGSRGDGKGQFQYPTSVAIGMHDGISEAITTTMRGIPAFYALPPGILPICIAYVGMEYIYVVDSMNDRIHVSNCDGKTIRTWGHKGSGDGEFNGPWGCSVSVNEIVYVTDVWNHRVQAFRSDGTFIRKWGTKGHAEDQFGGPRGICTTRNGLVFVADCVNERILCYHENGTLAREWAPQIDAVGMPWDVVVDDDENMVYVTDENNCIRQLRTDGTFIRTWGNEGKGDGQFNSPCGITKGADKRLYVADTDNRRIVAINLPI